MSDVDSQLPHEVSSLKEMVGLWQKMHNEAHEADRANRDGMREAWRADAMQWRENHTAGHTSHLDAHEREHSLNQQAINKAEAMVDKAVTSARETMEERIKAQGERLDHAEDERQRQMAEVREALHQVGLGIASATKMAGDSAKGIQAIQDAQSWIVKIVIGAIIMAMLALILRPGLM